MLYLAERSQTPIPTMTWTLDNNHVVYLCITFYELHTRAVVQGGTVEGSSDEEQMGSGMGISQGHQQRMLGTVSR